MRTCPILLIGLLVCTPAFAAGKVCLDPHYSYQARAIGGHDIVAKPTFGHDHRELRLSTTCINLSSAFHIALSSEFTCLDRGDSVFTSTIDGDRQRCRITNVQPYVPDQAPQHS